MTKKFPDSSPLPPGFVIAQLTGFRNGETAWSHLVLPDTPSVHAAVRELAVLAEAKADSYCRSKYDVKDQVPKDPKAALAAASYSSSSKSRNGKPDPEAERAELLARAQTDLAQAGPDQVPVYAIEEPLKLIDNKGATPDREVHDRQKELFQRLKAQGHLRQVAPTGEHTLTELVGLRAELPHFAAVIDLVRDQLLLARARRQPLSLPPLLLLGDPGVGKTHFSFALAQVLGTAFRRHSFDNDSSGSALVGSDKRWANTSYGLVFDLVCLGAHASPVIVLDELDKASTRQGCWPLAPLHTLLETVTAVKTRDISVDLEFDASRVIWIATANDEGRIEASILSRFTVFRIEAPTGEQALQVAATVAASVHNDMALADFEPPSRRIVHLLAHLSPREQGQALRRAYAAANAEGRNRLERQDLPAQVLLDDQEARASSGGKDPPTPWLH